MYGNFASSAWDSTDNQTEAYLILQDLWVSFRAHQSRFLSKKNERKLKKTAETESC